MRILNSRQPKVFAGRTRVNDNRRVDSMSAVLGRTRGHSRFLPVGLWTLISCLWLVAAPPTRVHYDGADWKLKGDGVVCCPCTVPCPCRSNSTPSYGHCEATLYVRIKQGRYGKISFAGMQVIDTGGMCAVGYKPLSALYFDRSASQAQRFAWEKLIASFSADGTADFPHIRVAPFDSKVTADRFFDVSIPGILAIIVDRDWGQSSPPMPMVAAPDHFSNAIQYAQNIRYRVSDPEAGLAFDYSHRQANYRIVEVTSDQYRSHSMLIQFEDGKGWFNSRQLQLIQAQHLSLPQLTAIGKQALRLTESRAQ